jgi:hypothetical protein
MRMERKTAAAHAQVLCKDDCNSKCTGWLHMYRKAAYVQKAKTLHLPLPASALAMMRATAPASPDNSVA